MGRNRVGEINVSVAADEIPVIPKAEKGQESVQLAAAEEQTTKKKSFRASALERRDSLTPEQRGDYSGIILKTLTSLPCYQEADAVLIYVSFRSEVDTFPLIEQAVADGKAVFAPRVLGREMEFYRIFSRDDLAAGYRGILEPAGGMSFDMWAVDWMSRKSDSRPHILVCLPGAAFDRARHRIGYGGGFYDRYLCRLLQENTDTDAAAHLQTGMDVLKRKQESTVFFTAALAYDCQIFAEIPWEAHDMRPMCVVTEKEILRE